MQTSTSTVIVTLVVLCLTVQAKPKPGIFYTYPVPESHTSVLRDALGNQATAYSYHDGHSSSVHVSRNDVSKHLLPVAPVHHYPIVPAHPVVYDHQPAVIPAAQYHHSFYDSYY